MMKKYFYILKFTLFVSLFLYFYNINLVQSEWQRTNIGGGGQMNIVSAGPTGTTVVGTDLGGAYIKKATENIWRLIGPDNGVPDTHITGIEFDNSNENIIMLASHGGLYKSQDEGNNFYRVDSISQNSGNYYGGKFLTLAYQKNTTLPSNKRRVYASRISNYNSKDGSILRSDDGGETFSYTNPLPRPTNSVITKIVIHPSDPDLLVVISQNERFVNPYNAIYMSDDGGETWKEIAKSIPNITDVVFHPIAPHYAYISNKNTYDSASVNFSNLKSSLDVNNDIWYPVFQTPDFKNKFYSPELILWPEKTSNSSIRVINTNTTWEFGNQTAWRLYNDGINWKSSPLGSFQDWSGDKSNWKLGWSKVHTLFSKNLESVNHTIGFDLSDNNNLLWSTNQFVLKGKQISQNNNYKIEFENLTTLGDETNGWQSTGLDNITPFILDVNQSNPDVIYAGLNDVGCILSKNGGNTWKQCVQNSDSWLEGFSFTKSYGAVVSALVSDPISPNTVWMFASGDQNEPVKPYLSNDYGKNWKLLTNDLPYTSDAYGLSIDHNSDLEKRRLFVTINGSVYRSENNGNTWNNVYNCNNGCRTTIVANNGYVYAGGEDGLFVSKNKGNSWQRILSKDIIEGTNNGNIFNALHNDWQGVSGLEVAPNNDNIIYAAVLSNSDNQGIYRCNIEDSINVDKNCNLILKGYSYIRDIAIDNNNPQILYASSSSAYTSGGYDSNSAGVLYSNDGGNNWKTINKGLVWPMVIPIVTHPTNSNIVYIGVPGSGHYKGNFYDGELDNDEEPDDDKDSSNKLKLLSPIGDSNVNPPTFSWEPVTGASSYTLWVNEYGNPNIPGKVNNYYSSSELGCNDGISNCIASPNLTFAEASSEWWVTAHDNKGNDIVSNSALFNVSNVSQIPKAPKPVYPINGEVISTNYPKFEWEPVKGATEYQLFANVWGDPYQSIGKINEKYTPKEASCSSLDNNCFIWSPPYLYQGWVSWFISAKINGEWYGLDDENVFYIKN